MNKMTDILLGQSYYLRYDAKEYKAMMPYPPLATLYVASFLRQHGYRLTLFDSMIASGEDEFAQAADRYKPPIVAIYDDNFNYLTKMCLLRMREAAFKMTKHAKAQNSTVIVWSSDATDHLEEYFKNNVDYVILGEAELTLKELLDFLTSRSKKSLREIPGLAFLENGKIFKTPKRELFRNLDLRHFPAWDLVDIERYRKIWLRHHGYFSMNMITTRGCPFHCNWCAKPIYGQVYEARSPENVVAEMKLLKENYRPDHIWFCDDIFGLKPGWIRRFSELVQTSKTVIPFKCLARVDLLLKEQSFQDLKNAGCQTVWVGAESGSQKILDAMEKGTNVEQIYEASAKLHQHGIRVGFFLQFGYPGEKKEDIQKTIQIVKDCKPDEIGVSVSYPLPGTKFYENVKTQLGIKQNWVDSQDLALLFPGEYPPNFYRVLHKVVHKEFRLQQGFGSIKEFFLTPWKMDRKKFRRAVLVGYYLPTLLYQRLKLKGLEFLSKFASGGQSKIKFQVSS